MLDGQGLELEGIVQWNIKKTIVGNKNIQRPHIDSLLIHTMNLHMDQKIIEMVIYINSL